MEEDFILSDNEESENGTWEYLRHPDENVIELLYWNEDSTSEPSKIIKCSVEEFNDLIKFTRSLDFFKKN